MRQTLLRATATSALVVLAFAQGSQAQQTGRSTIAQSLTPPALSQARVDAALIEFPLPKGQEAYRSIDGRKMHKYVEELAAISKRYRDAGHPKYWGRLIGTRKRAGDQ